MTTINRPLGSLLAFLMVPSVARAEDSPLTIADLAEYRAALTGKTLEAPVAVGFRALWDHPETYLGRAVQVEGKVVRRFRQGAFGTFPPLEEVWVMTPGDNPLCLVFPAPAVVAPGDSVSFAGTFLKRVEYRGADGPRLAPLIVGKQPPVVSAPAPPPAVPQSARGLSVTDWTVGLVVAALVVLVLARQHLRRPPRPLRIEPAEPPPDFLPPMDVDESKEVSPQMNADQRR